MPGAGALNVWVLAVTVTGGWRPTVVVRTHSVSHRPSRQSNDNHGEAALDRRGDPVLLWWRPNRCRARSQQTLRAHTRQKEHR